MPRSRLRPLLLLLASAGCADADKLNDLAKQAARAVEAAGPVVTTSRTPADGIEGLIDTFEQMADTLAAMHDEASATANVGQYKQLFLSLRGHFASLKVPSGGDDDALQRSVLAGRDRWRSALLRHAAEVQRISQSPEMRRIVVKALEELQHEPWTWDPVRMGTDSPIDPKFLKSFGRSHPFPSAGPSSAPASPAISATEPSPDAPLVGSLDRGGPPVHARIQETRDRMERMKQDHAALHAQRPLAQRPPPLEGADVVTIVVENTPADGFQDLVKRCAAITISTGYQAEKNGGQFIYRVRHTADLASISAKIDFAPVIRIDEPSRTITVKY